MQHSYAYHERKGSSAFFSPNSLTGLFFGLKSNGGGGNTSSSKESSNLPHLKNPRKSSVNPRSRPAMRLNAGNQLNSHLRTEEKL